MACIPLFFTFWDMRYRLYDENREKDWDDRHVEEDDVLS